MFVVYVGVTLQTTWFYARKICSKCTVCFESADGKYRKGQKELHCVLMDLEKAYDSVPLLRKTRSDGEYVRVIQDTYERNRKVVRFAAGLIKCLNVNDELRQGSALNLFLFVIVMDRLMNEIREETT